MSLLRSEFAGAPAASSRERRKAEQTLVCVVANPSLSAKLRSKKVSRNRCLLLFILGVNSNDNYLGRRRACVQATDDKYISFRTNWQSLIVDKCGIVKIEEWSVEKKLSKMGHYVKILLSL